MCKLAAVSTRKTFKEAAESLKKEMGAAREQYGEADVETVPQPLLDAEGRYHEAKDAYKEAVKAVRQARQQMGSWNGWVSDFKEGMQNQGYVTVW